MRILLTGANGFLASRLCIALKKHEVMGLTRGQMDFTDGNEVEKKVREISPDIIIHCGAVSDIGTCEKEPELSHKVNVLGTENIAKACGKFGAKLMFCSSDQVYLGHTGTNPHSEEESLCPPHVYGKQKLQAERKCLEFNEDSVILRLSWMYDKETRIGIEHGNLVTNVLQAVQEGKEVRYPVFDFRSITNVWEVAANMEKAFSIPPGIYNFGSENDLCTCDVVRHILKLKNISGINVVENRESFADKHRNLRMDIKKIREFGIDFRSTAEGLKEVL
ncbi:MAG: NAD(P)-dependent oxidoreductase [Clostridiales bacterium]|nr:NAD(P)-dependent oxidoreductase [Clostridiales bacterium]